MGQPNEPFFFPRIMRYVGVDEPCARRIREQVNIPPSRIAIKLNAVDTRRFRPRGPLPERPRRALLFTRASLEHRATVRKACRRSGLKLDIIGPGRTVADPERVLGGYDIVFAKARCALEAMAGGCAVVLCDAAGVGPMVSSRNFDELRPLNFGFAALRDPLSADGLCRQIAAYDPGDAAAVGSRVRAEAGLEAAAQGWLQLYREAIAEFQATTRDTDAELRAAAAYLARKSWESRMVWEREQLQKLKSIPLIGGGMHRIAHHFAKKIQHGGR